MKRDPSAPQLSAVFVDYDNIYLSLKRKNEEAAKRFSKDASLWLRAIEKGTLLRSNGGMIAEAPRRIVLNRCYGNPVPRRNQSDNATDMNSFPFVRHNFLRAGFEIVDCPPLTSQQKNAADIRMVMDLRDYLNHDTYFDEFIILSGDADFTPVLHRLRQHARRTVIYSNDHTAAAYAAICDGEVREADLIAALVDMPLPRLDAPAQAPVERESLVPTQPIVLQSTPTAAPPVRPGSAMAVQPSQLRLEDLRQMIIGEVVNGIRAASGPVPLEALADRAIRTLGHERTVGTAWAGAGSFRELMRMTLPGDLRMTDTAPFYAYDPQRHTFAPAQATAPVLGPSSNGPNVQAQREALAAALSDLTQADAVDTSRSRAEHLQQDSRPSRYAQVRPSAGPGHRAIQASTEAPPAALAVSPHGEPMMHRSVATRAAPVSQATPQRPDPAAAQQATMTRIREACQAPALSANDYRIVFNCLAQELSDNGLTGAQTLTAVAERAHAAGATVRREDVRFVLDVVSEPDPWFEQGATPTLFAGRFRNFVVARCRDHGLQLSAAELDLIDGWIMGGPLPPISRSLPSQPQETQRIVSTPAAAPAQTSETASAGRWWALDDNRAAGIDQTASEAQDAEDDFPRIVRTRQRG